MQEQFGGGAECDLGNLLMCVPPIHICYLGAMIIVSR